MLVQQLHLQLEEIIARITKESYHKEDNDTKKILCIPPITSSANTALKIPNVIGPN